MKIEQVSQSTFKLSVTVNTEHLSRALTAMSQVIEASPERTKEETRPVVVAKKNKSTKHFPTRK